MPVKITITISDEAYETVKAALKNNKQPRQDPNNPDAVIVAPVYPDVETWVGAVVNSNIEPLLSTIQKSAAELALEAEITARQEAIAAMKKVVTEVTKEVIVKAPSPK